MQQFTPQVSYGTCAWIIWASGDLWSGKRFVPGPVTEIYLGLAEAYGILMVLSFFLQYLCLYPLTIKQTWSIHVNCNNNGVTKCINNHPHAPHMWYNTRWLPHLFAKIQLKLHHLQLFSFVFHHVQDKSQTNPSLSPNNSTSIVMHLPPKLPLSQPAQPWPIILKMQHGTLAHLCINQQIIT